ncbi:class III poly(R)-hydroxyalkanoic acid synthase subunit PhaE [Cognatiluteimonas profundi]|uniref:class III poly(R)-hydroxyalkanoic acid synthase subunit PhaE n=1 Tax=Cognatiluteimonas profundi TaxID=2594501 RepID=UPI00131D5AE3|nr:class III poly(R)-hydroxyalkanoic acid synthase subunit PhaE [Lysobacter profundi]
MNTQWPGDFESLARQYWAGWGNAMRNGPATGGASTPNWQDAIDWWSKLAQGKSHDANATVDRFNAQARDWYGQMQQVAAQFAGHEAKPHDIAAEWKRAMGAFGDNPFPEMFRAMQGQGAHGLEQWTEAAAPWLDAWRRESKTLLGMPTFGIGREHQERLQKLAQAQLDLQQHENAYNALMLKSAERAYAVFERKLAERDAPGRQLTTARALFDLWIEAAEEAYAEMALSPEFRDAYGARVNAQMRLRQAVQGEVERMSATLGMPTRSDLDAAFRKIADLERAMRKLRDDIVDRQPDARAEAKRPVAASTKAPSAGRASAPVAARKAKPTAAARPAAPARARKTAAKQAIRKAPAKKTTAKGRQR